MNQMSAFRRCRITAKKCSNRSNCVRQFSNDAWAVEDQQFVSKTYLRMPLELVRGEGVHVFDRNNKKYMDFSGGIAVNALGHNHPRIRDALMKQFDTLGHVSNLFHSRPQIELAKRLIENSAFEKLFFCNSGTEANEGAIKFSRKFAFMQEKFTGLPKREKLIAFQGGFHGRTLGALSITHKPEIRIPFSPLISNVEFLPLNNIEAAKKAIDSSTAAVFVEPVQGESGIRPCTPEFLQSLRRFCSANGALLVVDEVQVGCGRTGNLWAHTKFGIKPDIMTIAKPLAAGFPIGAVLVSDQVNEAISAGDHGTTFGGNPVICAVACEAFDIINDSRLLMDVRKNGKYIVDAFKDFQKVVPDVINDVRSCGGLLIGIELSFTVEKVIQQASKLGLIVISAGKNVIRLAPPLIISRFDVESAVDILQQAILLSKD